MIFARGAVSRAPRWRASPVHAGVLAADVKRCKSIAVRMIR